MLKNMLMRLGNNSLNTFHKTSKSIKMRKDSGSSSLDKTQIEAMGSQYIVIMRK